MLKELWMDERPPPPPPGQKPKKKTAKDKRIETINLIAPKSLVIWPDLMAGDPTLSSGGDLLFVGVDSQIWVIDSSLAFSQLDYGNSTRYKRAHPIGHRGFLNSTCTDFDKPFLGADIFDILPYKYCTGVQHFVDN
ncbi:unnamed protein product [Phytophthora fragariaefolia]|uniref:Unnamed protein product n=1 Tax=Phytophthora fragariaefolia TaxID=1490495 RepID=A0A9W6YH13_9STRA|nr:unnamed protein product [Phytophthora fragariaefolia]